MKILHLCLSCFYVDGFSYQENELVSLHVADGHEVRVIASTEQIQPDGSLSYGKPMEYLGREGAQVERLAYNAPLPHTIAKKLRIHRGLYQRIVEFAPEVILFHGACSGDIATAARYVRNNPGVKLYVDSHEDFVNSARGFLSKWILHYLFYRPFLRSSLKWIEKVLPVSVSCEEFMRDFYGVPTEKLEFYPLGGLVPADDEYHQLRNAKRAELGLAPNQVLVVQSGKIDRTKKLVEALHAFSAGAGAEMVFTIAGHLQPDVRGEVEAALAADPRIRFLGWQQPQELRALLCAADVYCQPGTQSATMQMSLCCRCAIILDDIPSHQPYHDTNGWLVRDVAEMRQAFATLARHPEQLPELVRHSHELALRMLDYRLLAARLYR